MDQSEDSGRRNVRKIAVLCMEAEKSKNLCKISLLHVRNVLFSYCAVRRARFTLPGFNLFITKEGANNRRYYENNVFSAYL